MTFRASGAAFRSAAERAEPEACDSHQAMAVERVAPLSSDLLDADESGVLQDAQVTRRRWPRAGEAVRQRARSHRAVAGFEDLEDVATRLVCQRGEDDVDVVELALTAGASVS